MLTTYIPHGGETIKYLNYKNRTYKILVRGTPIGVIDSVSMDPKRGQVYRIKTIQNLKNPGLRRMIMEGCDEI